VNYDIDIKLYFDILANESSNDDVLLIEGDVNSLDYHIYNIFLKEKYTIIPIGDRGQVILNTKKMKTASHFKKHNIFGLIDHDNKGDEKLDSNIYKTKKECYTIEMIFLLKEFRDEYLKIKMKNNEMNRKELIK
jgi:hypothetical protein